MCTGRQTSGITSHFQTDTETRERLITITIVGFHVLVVPVQSATARSNLYSLIRITRQCKTNGHLVLKIVICFQSEFRWTFIPSMIWMQHWRYRCKHQDQSSSITPHSMHVSIGIIVSNDMTPNVND